MLRMERDHDPLLTALLTASDASLRSEQMTGASKGLGGMSLMSGRKELIEEYQTGDPTQHAQLSLFAARQIKAIDNILSKAPPTAVDKLLDERIAWSNVLKLAMAAQES